MSLKISSSIPSNCSQISCGQPVSLDNLKEEDLSTFFASHNEIKEPINSNKIDPLKSTLSKSTDYIHFIWMGNPIKEEYLDNILSWKNQYQKDIIIWVDNDSLEDNNLRNFAEKNNIKLIDIEKVFTDQYTFNLSDIIKLEKDRTPPNWGAISDIYRYLIMYYFAGTYSDTDENPKSSIDFEKNMVFSHTVFGFANDIIMTKNIKNGLWKEVLNEIKIRYDKNEYFGNDDFRLNSTKVKTGPTLLRDFVVDKKFKGCEEYLKDYQQLIYSPICSGSWCSELTPEICEKLSKAPNLKARIISNTIIDIKEKRILDLQCYNKIIEKANLDRKEIVNQIYEKLNSDKKHEITEFRCNEEERKRFSNLFTMTKMTYIDKECIIM